MIAVRPRSLDGATAIETKREVIHLEDGIVSRVSPLEGEPSTTSATSPLVGMRVVAWAAEGGHVYGEYVPGARAVLWSRGPDGEQTSLARTGKSLCFVVVRRAVTGSLTVPARGPSQRQRAAKPRSGIHRASTRAPLSQSR